MAFTCSKQWKYEFVKNVKYAWKPTYKIWSTIKAQERCNWCCSVVFIDNFRGVSIEDPVEHLQWSFSFVIQWTKAKIFNWALNTPLKLGTDIALITWIWFGWITWGFATSLMGSFIQIFQKFILKKNSNNLKLKTDQVSHSGWVEGEGGLGGWGRRHPPSCNFFQPPIKINAPHLKNKFVVEKWSSLPGNDSWKKNPKLETVVNTFVSIKKNAKKNGRNSTRMWFSPLEHSKFCNNSETVWLFWTLHR